MIEEEQFEFRRSVNYYLQQPIGETKAIWMVLHGYGQLAKYFIRKFSDLEKHGVMVVAPSAPSLFYVDGFSGRVGASWMTKHNREQEIVDHVRYLDELAESLSNRFELPITIFGFSQGVATAWRWADQGRILAERLILWSGRIPAEAEEESASIYRKKMPTYLLFGNQDEFSTPDVNKKAIEVLQRQTQFKDVVFEGKHDVEKATLAHYAKAFNWY